MHAGRERGYVGVTLGPRRRERLAATREHRVIEMETAAAFPGDRERLDLARARELLVDPERGFIVWRGFWSAAEARRYRGECERFMATGPRIHQRINTDAMPDYIHPRSHDATERTYRIYQFFHNHHSRFTDALLGRSMDIRNAIEEAWTADPVYLAERRRLQDYVIVTKYIEDTGKLPRHNDYQGEVPFPFIQFLVLLSQPGEDYRGGELILHTKAGRAIRIQDDLGVREGDALLFDKTLLHEVEDTLGGVPGGAGRWSVLIGARAPRDGWLAAQRKALFYSEAVYPRVIGARRRLRALAGRG